MIWLECHISHLAHHKKYYFSVNVSPTKIHISVFLYMLSSKLKECLRVILTIKFLVKLPLSVHR